MKQYFTAQYWKGQRLLLLTFLLVHVIVAAFHISNTGVTVDEPDYYTYAARWAHGKVERDNKMFDSKSPIVAVALIPRIIKQLQQPDYKATDNGIQDVKNGRYLLVIYTIIIALYLFKWIRKLFGAKAWIFPVLFFLFDPMVISFSMITTSDMATGSCLIGSMYHLYRFYYQKSWKQFVAFSIWLGVSFVCKASLLFLLPCLVLLYLFLLLTGKLKFSLKNLIVYGGLSLLISIAVINIAYFGKDTLHTLNEMKFSSSAFKNLAATQVINQIPVPVPSNYIASLDLLQYHAEIGAGTPESSYPGVFINGKLKHKGGFWYYYLFTGLFKIPVAILLLIVAGIATLLFKFRIVALHSEKYVWFLFPAFFFFVILSFFNPLQLGFRHFLMIYPLFFIGIAALLKYWQYQLKYSLQIVSLLFIYLLTSVAVYFPDLIAYTNEFVVDKKNVFRMIRDASIDYGQNNDAVAQYVLTHPEVTIPSKTPKPGKYIVTMMQLFDEGPASAKPKFFWLLNFEPVTHYKYSNFIFNISEKDIARLKEKSSAR